ncbi:MAG: DUF6807 family protein [Candidatus Brocadiia bacterium]
MRPAALLCASLCLLVSCGLGGEVALEHDRGERRLAVQVEGRTAIVYCYSPDHFLPYFWPVKSPSGKDLTVRLTKPYPHHRSFWFTDKVQLEGQRVTDFYNAYYRYKEGKGEHIRHQEFAQMRTAGDRAFLTMELQWLLDLQTPVLDERREVAFRALGDGEYLLDIRFTVAASHGDVHWRSDAVHYAWPYVRMHPEFSVKQGGTLVNSEGGKNQKGTHNKVADWCDYSNTVDGTTEGLALFSHPENDRPHRWLTRDYGCFGPRRIDARSGKPFTLERGQSLARRVGVLVHKGDVAGGRVAERYRAYAEGDLALLPPKGK